MAEVTLHQAQRLLDSRDKPGWISDMRELIGAVQAEFSDISDSGFKSLLAPDNYLPSQAFARELRANGGNGIAYPSVRNPGAECIAALWSDVAARSVQGRHFRYHWNGVRIDIIHEHRLDGKGEIFRLEI